MNVKELIQNIHENLVLYTSIVRGHKAIVSLRTEFDKCFYPEIRHDGCVLQLQTHKTLNGLKYIQMNTSGHGVIVIHVNNYTRLCTEDYAIKISTVKSKFNTSSGTDRYIEEVQMYNMKNKNPDDREILRIEVPEFINMTSDSIFQYSTVYEDFEYYHAAFCYCMKYNIHIQMNKHYLEKYNEVLQHLCNELDNK